MELNKFNNYLFFKWKEKWDFIPIDFEIVYNQSKDISDFIRLITNQMILKIDIEIGKLVKELKNNYNWDIEKYLNSKDFLNINVEESLKAVFSSILGRRIWGFLYEDIKREEIIKEYSKKGYLAHYSFTLDRYFKIDIILENEDEILVVQIKKIDIERLTNKLIIYRKMKKSINQLGFDKKGKKITYWIFNKKDKYNLENLI